MIIMLSSPRKKSLKKIGVGIIITVLSLAILSFAATKVVYDATFERYDTTVSIPGELTALVSQRQPHSFESGSNLLQGYLYPASNKGLVVLVPGYHAGTDSYLYQIQSLVQAGWNVFCFDPTGCCRSQGESAVGFSQILLDLEAALHYIENNQRFGCDALFLMGHSRGAYGVCGVLDKGYAINGVVAISGVNSCMEAIIQPAADAVGPLAYGNYPFLWAYQAVLFGGEITETDCTEIIVQSNVPVLVVQGTQDERYPPNKYSIFSHMAEHSAETVEYYVCNVQGQNGHTSLLFDPSGCANMALMNRIDRFLQDTITDF